jgi:DNA-binding NarL/FixJ family response regulator
VNQLRVLLADDHPAVRKGIQMILSAEPGIQIIGEAEDCQDAVEMAICLQPNVVLIDLLMPKGCGIDSIAEIRRRLPDVKIVVLSMVSDERVVKAATEAGADAYLLKDAGEESLLQAFRTLQFGEANPDLRLYRDQCQNLSRGNDTRGSKLLTPREREILRLVAMGMTNQDVAQALGISENTAKAHVSHILEKLDVSHRTEAAIWAARLGLILPQGDT